MNETKHSLVILEITDDKPGRDWAPALGLPPVHYWDTKLPTDVHAQVIYEHSYHTTPVPDAPD